MFFEVAFKKNVIQISE